MDGVSTNLALPNIYSLPQEVTSQIIVKLHLYSLIQFTGTCKGFYDLREHGWEWLCKQDFRWLCSPSMKITSNPGISWQGLYKALAQDTQNIQWKKTTFNLDIKGKKIEAGLNAQGDLVVLSVQKDENKARKGVIQTGSLDGKSTSSIEIPSAIFAQIENSLANTRYLPKNNAFLFGPYDDKGYLYLDSILYPLEKMADPDLFQEIDENLFIHVHDCHINVLRIDNQNNMQKEDLPSPIENILNLVPLPAKRFLIHNIDVCIFSPDAQGWSQSKGILPKNQIDIKSLPNGMLVSSYIKPERTLGGQIAKVFRFLTIDASKDEIVFECKRTITINMKNNWVDQIEQLPNGGIVYYCDEDSNSIGIWPKNNNEESNNLALWDYAPCSSEIFVHPETGQVIALTHTEQPLPHYVVVVFSPSLDLSACDEKSG